VAAKIKQSRTDIFVVLIRYYIHYFIVIMVQTHDSNTKQSVDEIWRNITSKFNK